MTSNSNFPSINGFVEALYYVTQFIEYVCRPVLQRLLYLALYCISSLSCTNKYYLRILVVYKFCIFSKGHKAHFHQILLRLVLILSAGTQCTSMSKSLYYCDCVSCSFSACNDNSFYLLLYAYSNCCKDKQKQK